MLFFEFLYEVLNKLSSFYINIVMILIEIILNLLFW